MKKGFHLLVSTLKVVGIALLYAAVGYILCRTVTQCLWEPFLRWDGGDSLHAWPLFVRYYNIFLQVATALVAFFAGRSYRPFFEIGGVAAGTAAALIFRYYEREQWTRPHSISTTLLAASSIGLLFGLLGSVSSRRRKRDTGSQAGVAPAVS
jgi:hypothetical protein